jgi:FAD/FMN-containing dehydrogenase
MESSSHIVNFGRNVSFRPPQVLRPQTERDLLAILEKPGTGKIRVIASRHAWSPLIETDGTLIDMENFVGIEVFQQDGANFVRVGAGCRITKLVKVLNQQGLTLPSLGLITEQRVAGAISTGTHGSGKPSLSHFVQAMRVACFPEDGAADIRKIDHGPDLAAARCALGCLGVIVDVTFPCIPQYRVREQVTPRATIEAVLELESASPLQQFFLFPHAGTYYVQQRTVAEQLNRSRLAWLYQVYWFVCIDIGLHLLVKLVAVWLRSRRLIHLMFRRVIPLTLFPRWVVVDRSDRLLTMEHQLFRHLELELFVPASRVAEAARFLESVLRAADGLDVTLPESQRETIEQAGLRGAWEELRGTYTHHYPICFRKVLRDDTLISMSSGDEPAWYAISLITYLEPRDEFYQFAAFLARSMHRLFGARIHWGKWFPLDAAETRAMYPKLAEFRDVCHKYDPRGVFRNEFVQRLIFSGGDEPEE